MKCSGEWEERRDKGKGRSGYDGERKRVKGRRNGGGMLKKKKVEKERQNGKDK